MSVKAEVTDVIPSILPGLFAARFDDIALKVNDNGTFWQWTWTVDVPKEFVGDKQQFGEDDALIPITATTSPRITPRTKAAMWIASLRGSEVEIGETIDFDEYTGKTAQVIIIIADNGYSRIEKVLPAARTAPRQSKAKSGTDGTTDATPEA
jgi:hypothetical protein